MREIIKPTEFKHNPYEEAWYDRDYFHSPDGVKEFPKHHCKLTFEASRPFIKRMRNAIDVGCRDGEYTRYLQKIFNHTYCFDPTLKENFCYNVDLSKVTHFTCALGDEDCTVQMYGSGYRFVEGKMRDVSVYRLDEFELKDIDYIKIDVEGFEKKVLAGGWHTIDRDRPLIVIEQNEVCLEGEQPGAAKAWLEERGYRHVATCPRGWDFIMVSD